MTSPSRYDVIVAGGGHNGLVAAFYLARAGKRVLVLERRGAVGGPAAPVEFFPGYRGAMTNSPGSLEPRIVADMELEKLGLRWVKPDPAVVMPFPSGRIFVGWRDQAKLRTQMARDFSPRDAEAYPKLFAFFDDFARRLKVSLFEPPPSLAELVARLRSPRDEADFARIFFGSIRDYVEEHLESDEIRTAIAMLSLPGAVAPSTPGTPVALLQRPMSMFSSSGQAEHDPRNQPLRGSTGLPLGGMGSIAEAMRRAIERHGAEVRVGAPVARILVDTANAIRGVALADGSEFRAPVVLSNIHPRTTLIDLLDGGQLPDDMADRLRRLPKGAGAFKVVLAVDEPPLFAGAPPELAHAYGSCQVRVADSMEYLEQGHRDFVAGRATRCPRIQALFPSMSDPTMAPPGRHLLSINAWFYAPDLVGTDWAREGEAVGQSIVDQLARYVPSLKRSIVARKIYTPDDFEREFGMIGGNFAHLDMTADRMFGLRPLPELSRYRTPVRGLYLCGSGTWPGGTITGLPGHNAAHQALRDLAGGTQSQVENA